MTKRFGPRLGRPPRDEPKSRPIWCGQIDEETRQRILEVLSPEERAAALMIAVKAKEAMSPEERMAAILEASEEQDE